MLVRTILSQNTTDTNRDRAYDGLLTTFSDLRTVADATEDQIAQAICVGGLQHQKARTIHSALTKLLGEQGRLDLSFLGGLSPEEARSWLTSVPGIGNKTAGIVMLFGFGMPYFPVDTHIRRVLTRVGWIAASDDPHKVLRRTLPPDADLMSDLHLLLIQLGRALCHPRHPECPRCPIREDCHHGREQAKEHS
jgi:endonuclease-3